MAAIVVNNPELDVLQLKMESSHIVALQITNLDSTVSYIGNILVI